MIILEENFKWHLEAFASELFICTLFIVLSHSTSCRVSYGEDKGIMFAQS